MKFFTVILAGLILLAAGCTINNHDRERDRSSDDGVDTSRDTREDTDYDTSGDSSEITFEFFYDRLSPHGEWVEIDGHGWCWYPHHVEVEWRPYSHGNWLYADDCGWYWHSDYEWSWAGEHYGRWTYSSSRWYWVPGYEWSGGWVAWRDGDDHCGWAPLPPHAHWEAGVGIRSSGFNVEVDIYEPSWVFVAHADFTHTSVHTVMLSSRHNSVHVRDCRYRGSVSVSGGIIVNHAITLDVAVKFTGRKIERRKLHSSGTLGEAKAKGGNGEIRVFRPHVKKGDSTPPRKDDKERIARSDRKTMDEKHKAEDRETPRKDKDSGKGEDDRDEKRDDIDKRQKKENDDLDNRHGKDSGKQPEKDRTPDKDAGKESEKDLGKKNDSRKEKDSGKDKNSGKEKDSGGKGNKGGGKK